MTEGFKLPPEIKMLEETITEFVRREIRPIEQELPASATRIPESALKGLQDKTRALGLWHFGAPLEYGGAGLSPFELVVAMEAASQHAFSIPTPGGGAFGYEVPHILLQGSPDQISLYYEPSVREGKRWFVAITEPSGGSDPARAIQTTARRDGNEWVISGRKMFISGVGSADYGIVFARTGAPNLKGRSITAFIVAANASGISHRFTDLIRDEGTYEVLLDGVRVPVENQLGPEGQGFSLAQSWMIRNRLILSAFCIGIAQAALELAVSHVRERKTFGAPLATRQSVQWMIADSATELRAARWLTWEAAWQLEQGKDARYESSIAKLYSSEHAYNVVDRVIQMHGGMGVSRELPLERWFRGLRTERIVEGPSEIHRYLIAREILGKSALG